MWRCIVLVVVFAGCQLPAKPPVNKDPAPSTPFWPGSASPEPDWSNTSGVNASISNDARRISPPVRAFDGNVKITTPTGAAPGQELPVRIDWQTDQPAIVRHPIPDGVQILRTDPPARLAGRDLEWNVAAGQGSALALYQPVRPGRIDFECDITDGIKHHLSQASTAVGVVQLRLRVTGPQSSSIGDSINFDVQVTNGGQVPASRATLRADLDAGLEHASGNRRIEFPIGLIAPGETRTFTIPAGVKQSGSLPITFSVLAESGATITESLHVNVREPRLAVTLDGPAQVMVNQKATWTLRVVNDGDAIVSNIAARIQLPPELIAESGSKSSWTITSLKPREATTFQLFAKPIAPVKQTSLVASAVGDRVAEARADLALEAIGVPMLKLTVRGSDSIVETGKSLIYTIEVLNIGSMPLKDIDVAISLPGNLQPKHGIGPTIVTIDGNQITFGRMTLLEAGQSMTFRLEAEATNPGDARITVQARSASLPSPIRQDEATRIVAK